MFWRDSALVATAFVFIFGWKVTAALDLILVASLMLSVWVFVLSDLRLAPAELRIAACLIALSAYSVAVAIAFGGVDVQTALRSLRAVINFLGAAALVRIYASCYGADATARVVLTIFVCILLHALLICAMFLNPPLRRGIYALASTYEYVNLNTPLLLGLRIPGLTYGLASTSVVQLSGLLLSPLVFSSFGTTSLRRLLLWVSIVPIVASIFLTGRTGLLFGLAFLPVLLVFSRQASQERRPGWGLGRIVPFVVVAGAIAFVTANYGTKLGETFAYTLERAGEILELFDSGRSETTTKIASMYFLPSDSMTLIFGSSNSGRGDLSYIASDVGYIKLIFAVGILGTAMNLLPYIGGLHLAWRCYLRRSLRYLALATALCLVAGLLLNFKELALLTRNQWSVQSLLIALCVWELRWQRATAPAVRNVEAHA